MKKMFFVFIIGIFALSCHKTKTPVDPPVYCSEETEPRASCDGRIQCSPNAVCIQDRCLEAPVFYPVTNKTTEKIEVVDALCFDSLRLLSLCNQNKLPRVWAHYDQGKIVYGLKKTSATIEYPICGIRKPASSKEKALHVTFCQSSGKGDGKWKKVVLDSVPTPPTVPPLNSSGVTDK